jgi:hypothetical protein
MEAQIIEGTLADVQKQLLTLPFKPDAWLRVIVTKAETSSTGNETFLSSTQRRNGLILVPTRDWTKRVTTELVDELTEG